MKVTFIGATHEVTGSCSLLEVGNSAFLVDCGMEQGENRFENIPLPVNPAELSCVLLTHAHIDHSGYLPLLYKNGFDAGKYVSFEEQINNYKAYYYEALRQSSAGWETNENSYFPFIENFLSTLYMCYKELDKRFAVVHGKKITKKARVEATVLNSLTPLSKVEICKILPDVSPTTVEAVLGAMVKTGSVKRIGSGRATRYIKV